VGSRRRHLHSRLHDQKSRLEGRLPPHRPRYPLAVARLARAHGTRGFALTSSTGAAPHAKSFYLRTKGELERDLDTCGFPSITIVRPSLIGGQRDESRPAERLAQLLMTAFRPILPRRYRMVPAESIARALLEAALSAIPGRHVIESEGI
jgi:uncharacterized protein YbjT (DUF2867 family)